MASRGGQVVVRGRFTPGSTVRLVKVDGEHVMRPEGGQEVAAAVADETRSVRFRKGVEVGARYFAVGLDEGIPAEVRARGLALDDESAELVQPPVAPDRPRQVRGAPSPPREPLHTRQEDVRKGTAQRSHTATGQATPVE